MILLKQFDAVISTPDAVDELDRAILQLAVQGKLVPQDPNDEPASELLKRIRDAQDLEGFGELVRKKPSRSADDELFELPEGWEWVTLGLVSSNVHYGYTASADATLKEYRMLRITDIQDSRVNWETVPGCDITEQEAEKYLLNDGDILIARTGGTIGKSYLVKNLNLNVVFASYLIRVLLFRQLYPEFIKIFLDSPTYWTQLIEKSKGTGQPNVNATSLSQLVFALPPFAEQHRIVARVEQLFAQTRALREKLSRAQTELERLNESALAHLLSAETPKEFADRWSFIADHFDTLYSEPEHIAPLRQAILELAVRGKLTRRESDDEPASQLLERIRQEKNKLAQEGKIKNDALPPIQEDEKPFELPVGWEWVRLSQVCRLITDGTHVTPNYISKGIPFISVNNLVGNHISFDRAKFISVEEHKILTHRCRPDRDDVLLGKVGSVGVCDVVSTDVEFSIFVQIALIKPFKEVINSYFLKYAILSPTHQEQINRKATGTTLRYIGVNKINQLLFPLPPLAEQQRIIARVEQLMKLCDALEGKLTAARDERERLTTALLAEIGSGEGGDA